MLVEDILAKGEIAGFMQWSDLQQKTMVARELVCLVDYLDPLIKAGWTMVQETPVD